MGSGRPPLAHQGSGPVAQPHGGDGSFAIDPVQLGLARGGGKPLPPAVLAKMEAAFGADFSAVRVHVGPQASRIGAVAFTTGEDLYFAPGRYQPESVQGQQLLGHELAHVIQQRQGRVRAPGNGMAVVQDRMLEAEADRLGMRAAAHRPPLQAKMAESGRSQAQVHISAPGGTLPGSYRLTAGPGGNPVGSLVVHTKRGATAEVTDLGVAPGHRDQGIGRQLLVSAARAGLRSGNSKLSLSAQDNGTGKLTRWYKDMGFQQVGVNGRGMPVLEAPISRLLGGAVQRSMIGSIQRSQARPQRNPRMTITQLETVFNSLAEGWSKDIGAGTLDATIGLQSVGQVACSAQAVLSDGVVVPGKFDSEEFHAEMDLLDQIKAAGKGIADIHSIQIEKQPCPRCAVVLSQLDLASKVTYKKSGQKDYPTWRFPTIFSDGGASVLGVAGEVSDPHDVEELIKWFRTKKWW
jgi:ribosomal protein S18 acetylase RimI-like enzyme